MEKVLSRKWTDVDSSENLCTVCLQIATVEEPGKGKARPRKTIATTKVSKPAKKTKADKPKGDKKWVSGPVTGGSPPRCWR